MEWENRFIRLVQEIKQYNCDILCLQEVQNDHFDTHFKCSLEMLGYDGIYKKRTGDKQDGCAIFFKVSMSYIRSTICIAIKLTQRPPFSTDKQTKYFWFPADPTTSHCIAASHGKMVLRVLKIIGLAAAPVGVAPGSPISPLPPPLRGSICSPEPVHSRTREKGEDHLIRLLVWDGGQVTTIGPLAVCPGSSPNSSR